MTKRTLAIEALDTTGVHGTDEPTYEWDIAFGQPELGCNGLAIWDTTDTVFSTNRVVSREGAPYATLSANTYDGVIKVVPGESANYMVAESNCASGDLIVRPASLIDAERFSASMASTVYYARLIPLPVCLCRFSAVWASQLRDLHRSGVSADLRSCRKRRVKSEGRWKVQCSNSAH